MSAPMKRSVRFNESTSDQPPQKPSRPSGSLKNGEDAPRLSVLRPSSHKVRGKSRDRINEDELDDIDDWNEQEDGVPDNDGNCAPLPSQSQLIEAKRKRREQQGASSGLFNDNDNHLNEAETSLANDGIKIEPFHMREEETDGTGYFDGGTYVFRKNVPAEDGEADAWADTLMLDGNGHIDDANEDRLTIKIARNKASRKETDSLTMQEDLDDLSKEQLYKRITPLMGDAMESIMEAIRRYGKVAKTKYNSKNRRKQFKLKEQETNKNDNSINVAKSHLDNLTGVANALLLKGEVDIYDTTRQAILRMFPSLSENLRVNDNNDDADTKISKPNWEYQGNEDNKLHGPYTTEQMVAWVRSGYFVETQRVKIRTIHVQEQADEEKVEPKLSTEDDLLADLMDDDDEEEEDKRPSKRSKGNRPSLTIKGGWMWSNEINYEKYL